MDQNTPWDREYTTPTFTSFSDRPHKDVVEFFRTLKKEFKFDPYGKSFLDVGCGIGKDMLYAKETLGMEVSGFDISSVAIKKATEISSDARVGDAGKRWQYKDQTFDVIIDHMTFHCLDHTGRANYVKELMRVLKPGGFVFIKTFAKEGDSNAHQLLKNSKASEENSYMHPTLWILEHVFTKSELENLFTNDFTVLSLTKDAGYQTWNNQPYKRFYWLLALQKI